jgi:hypothetical protein
MVKAEPIKEGLFFPDDFSKLKGKFCIFIKEGKIIELD